VLFIFQLAISAVQVPFILNISMTCIMYYDLNIVNPARSVIVLML